MSRKLRPCRYSATFYSTKSSTPFVQPESWTCDRFRLLSIRRQQAVWRIPSQSVRSTRYRFFRYEKTWAKTGFVMNFMRRKDRTIKLGAMRPMF